MSERLTPEELTQIVLEIEKMRSRTENELTREQVKEILQELYLSPEFLDDALMQLRRKQALREQQKRHRAIAIGTFAERSESIERVSKYSVSFRRAQYCSVKLKI